MSRPWKFSENTFDVMTRKSNNRMFTIGWRTDERLAAKLPDPEFQIIYNDYHPVWVSYHGIYNSFDMNEAYRISNTLNFETEIGRMKEMLALFEGKVRNIYPEGTPTEVRYFPNKRKPFYEGTYLERIDAVKILGDKMADDPNPSLAAYAPTVLSYFNTLDAALELQLRREGKVRNSSSARKNARKLLAEALYGVLGRLMFIHRTNPKRIADYFDVSLLRQHEPVSLSNTELRIRGKVRRSDNSEPVRKVAMLLYPYQGRVISKTTTAKGNYVFDIKNITKPGSGTVTIKIIAPGFEPYEHTMNVITGNSYKLNIQLTPAQGLLLAA